MHSKIDRSAVRRRIRHRIRKKVHGTQDRPRLAVFRSGKHIYAQVVDDAAGKTLASSSTLMPDVALKNGKGGNVVAAEKVGATIAEKLKSAGIDSIVFDRGGCLYHGRVKALADAARKAGLKF
jgi:large subunit ribosomal protein L18